MERAARIHKYGPPEVLTIEPVDAPLPGPGEALIRHTAIGLRFVEVYFRRSTFADGPRGAEPRRGSTRRTVSCAFPTGSAMRGPQPPFCWRRCAHAAEGGSALQRDDTVLFHAAVATVFPAWTGRGSFSTLRRGESPAIGPQIHDMSEKPRLSGLFVVRRAIAYNLKRMIAILGAQQLIQAMRAA